MDRSYLCFHIFAYNKCMRAYVVTLRSRVRILFVLIIVSHTLGGIVVDGGGNFIPKL